MIQIKPPLPPLLSPSLRLRRKGKKSLSASSKLRSSGRQDRSRKRNISGTYMHTGPGRSMARKSTIGRIHHFTALINSHGQCSASHVAYGLRRVRGHPAEDGDLIARASDAHHFRWAMRYSKFASDD